MSTFYATRNSVFSGDIGDQSANFETTNDRARLLDSVNMGAENDPKSKFWTAIGFILSAALIGGVVGGLYTGLPLAYTVPTTTLPTTTSSGSSLQTVGQSCSVSSQCIPSAYCDNSTLCACSPQFFYDSSTGTCRGRKGFGESCSSSTDCEFSVLLTCSSSTCQCDSLLFWNPYTHMCEDKRGLGYEKILFKYIILFKIKFYLF
jgi:hypothetical protein